MWCCITEWAVPDIPLKCHTPTIQLQHHIQEDWNPQSHHSENHKTCKHKILGEFVSLFMAVNTEQRKMTKYIPYLPDY
jgi:hypothetical protein